MHEYPITCEIIRVAEAYAKNEGYETVCEIGLVVGDYSGFVGDSIQMYFQEIARGTCCEQCRVVISYIKPKWRCTVCGCLFERKLLSFQCTTCGGEGEPTDIGKEFYIEYIKCKGRV